MALTRRALLGTTLGAAALLAGCSEEAVSPDTKIVDVRTPAEFAAGHLEGATNIDVEANDFATKVATLDKNASYLVYCRSGNRSAQAKSKMSASGFAHVTDGGAMEAAATKTGKKIVKG